MHRIHTQHEAATVLQVLRSPMLSPKRRGQHDRPQQDGEHDVPGAHLRAPLSFAALIVVNDGHNNANEQIRDENNSKEAHDFSPFVFLLTHAPMIRVMTKIQSSSRLMLMGMDSRMACVAALAASRYAALTGSICLLALTEQNSYGLRTRRLRICTPSGHIRACAIFHPDC